MTHSMYAGCHYHITSTQISVPQCVQKTRKTRVWKTRFPLPHCCTTLPFQGTPANIRKNLIESLGYIVVTDSVVYLNSNFRGGIRKTHGFLNAVHNGPSRSSKVIDVGTNRKRVCDFL